MASEEDSTVAATTKIEDVTKKLSKKQKKALEFREKKKSGESTKEIKEKRKSKKREREQEQEQEQEKEQPKAKKSKSKGSGSDGGSKKKFILFIGNLPYNVTEDEIKEHFKAAAPLTVRPRKGFAFAEFEGNDAARRLNVALRLHHTVFKSRKINVELTAGGGGNTTKRRQKLKERNDKLRQELSEQRITKEAAKGASTSGASSNNGDNDGIHPERLRNMK